MTVTVHSHGKWVTLSRDDVDNLRHEVPRKNKFFKEELRLFREEIVSWLRGERCDHLIVYKPMRISFYRKAVLFAVVKATRRSDCLCLITTYEESANVTR